MSRPAGCDLTLFKAVGMGMSDLALGIEVLARVEAGGFGRSGSRKGPRAAASKLTDGGARPLWLGAASVARRSGIEGRLSAFAVGSI